MSKLYRQPIQVQTSSDDIPVAFCWRHHTYNITSCVFHVPQPSMFQRHKPQPPFYQCETAQGLVCDLVREGDGWVLEMVWD